MVTRSLPRGRLIRKLPSGQASLLPMGVLLLTPIQQNPTSIPFARLVGSLNTPPTLSFPLKEPQSRLITDSPLINKCTHNIRVIELYSHVFPFLTFFYCVSCSLESMRCINRPSCLKSHMNWQDIPQMWTYPRLTRVDLHIKNDRWTILTAGNKNKYIFFKF